MLSDHIYLTSLNHFAAVSFFSILNAKFSTFLKKKCFKQLYFSMKLAIGISVTTNIHVKKKKLAAEKKKKKSLGD